MKMRSILYLSACSVMMLVIIASAAIAVAQWDIPTSSVFYGNTSGNLSSCNCTWAQIQFKPTLFPTSWSNITFKPTLFPTSWSNITGTPQINNSNWWKYEKNQFISPNETRLTIVTPNGTIPYGNAWYDTGSGITSPNISYMHTYDEGFYDDIYLWRGNTSGTAYQTADSNKILPSISGLALENIQATHRNDFDAISTLYNKGYKATEFFQGDENVGMAVSMIKEPMHLSYTYPYLQIRLYSIFFKRPYATNYTPSFVCTCGFDEDNADWFFGGGEIDCSFYGLSHDRVTGVCSIKDGTDSRGDRVTYAGNVVMNWQVISEEDYGFNQKGSDIAYTEGGLP